jgi:hypothetical protein
MPQRCLFIDAENNATLREVAPEPGAHCFRLDRKYLCYAGADHPEALPIWVTVGRSRFEIRNVESAAGPRIPVYREIARMGPETGRGAAPSATRDAVGAGERLAAAMPVGREEAREIAERYLARCPEHQGRAIERVVSYEEIVAAGRPPRPYTHDASDLGTCWIVYLTMPGATLRCSEILLISRIDGRVAFHGSANDEG